MVEQQLKKDWLPKGIDYYRVENKITLRSKSQIIKLKYWLYQDNFKRYCTQYCRLNVTYRRFFKQ